MKLPSSKESLILTAALIIPGGFVALGLWKAYELYRKKSENDNSRKENKTITSNQSNLVGFDSNAEFGRIHSSQSGDETL